MITEREEFRMIPKFLAYVTEWIVMPFMRSRFFFHLFGKSRRVINLDSAKYLLPIPETLVLLV